MSVIVDSRKSSDQFVEGVLEEGLSYIASYLEKITGCSVIISDHNGCIHYPAIHDNADGLHICFNDLGNNPYYHRENNDFYFSIKYNYGYAYVIIKKLPPGLAAKTLTVLKEISLAVKCYFSKATVPTDSFAEDLGDYIMCKSNLSIYEILNINGKSHEMMRPYFILLVKPEEEYSTINWQQISNYSKEFFRKSKISIISIMQPDELIMAIPAFLKINSAEPDMNWPFPCFCNQLKEQLSKELEVRLSYGIGQIYPLTELSKSYTEAQVALTLFRILGEKDFVHSFSSLGVFSILFTKDNNCLHSYCISLLGKLLDYDDKTEGKLLPTLRTLTDNCFSYKDTANKLFIHINTLYYRINRIEEILGVNLSHAFVRVNIYLAIKIWDTLNRINKNEV